jgi:hypothetical protein
MPHLRHSDQGKRVDTARPRPCVWLMRTHWMG